MDFENEELGCTNQQQFSAGGAGALPIYWDKDWASPYSCKLVNYQTAHSALAEVSSHRKMKNGIFNSCHYYFFSFFFFSYLRVFFFM